MEVSLLTNNLYWTVHFLFTFSLNHIILLCAQHKNTCLKYKNKNNVQLNLEIKLHLI